MTDSIDELVKTIKASESEIAKKPCIKCKKVVKLAYEMLDIEKEKLKSLREICNHLNNIGVYLSQIDTRLAKLANIENSRRT